MLLLRQIQERETEGDAFCREVEYRWSSILADVIQVDTGFSRAQSSGPKAAASFPSFSRPNVIFLRNFPPYS